MNHRTSIALAVAVLLSSAVFAPPARAQSAAPPTTTCDNAYVSAQKDRAAHQLVEARDELRVCAQSKCKGYIIKDCTTWLDEVQAAVPSVIPVASDDQGNDLLDVTVTIDGAAAQKIDGKAIDVDPGRRTFVFTASDGRKESKVVVVSEGEKGKKVAATFHSATPASAPPPVAPAAQPSPVGPAPAPASSPPSSAGSTQRTLGVVFMVGGGVALAASGVVGLLAKSKFSKAQGESGPSRVTDSQSAVGEGNVATVLLVGGALAAAGGLVFWFTAPSGSGGTTLGFTGDELVLRGRF